MKNEQLITLIFGLILGVLLMFFWNLGSSLNNQNIHLNQLEQVTQNNSQSINEVINFINSITAQEGAVMPEQGGEPMIVE